MLIASEPYGFLRAAHVAMARVQMKYGTKVLETGKWWWELDERARPHYNWTEERIRATLTAGPPDGATYATNGERLFGIEIRFVPPGAPIPGDLSHLGRITLHTDRTDLAGDSGLYR